MPPRGDYPGLKRNKTGKPYWIARQVTRNPLGFPDLCIPLPEDAEEVQLAEICQQHTARLQAWIETVSKEEPSLTRTRYDGTMRTACQIYQEHPLSTFNSVKHNTRRGYLADLTVIVESVGQRLIRNVTVLDVKNWYQQWRKGVVYVDEAGNQTIGPERVARAHNAVAMVRMVLRFMAALRHPDCKLLAEELANVQFEREGAREQELTYQHVRAFIRTAFDLAEKGVMPQDRALYMAIGTASQFELMLRQKDIIGDWAPRNATARFPAGISIVHLDDETWSGFFTWESVPGWRWRTRTSKSKYRSPAEFDLTLYDLLFPLLEMVPMDQRHGAIVKGEHGLPIRYRSYAKWWRQIATAAGIPVEVQSMDARAGGATEAEEAGANLEGIQANLTHTKKEMSLRYIRRRTKKIAAVAEVRKLARGAGEGDGTA
ncbi:putative Phage integrase [Bradyrhizobium sp. STM 3843]|uniref:putative Phage integrase n=1 Tax=Bradyrhizobium sp. STM 3843 TaxID=551947 RepID=UPI0002406BC1|nr:putative Phage integrase [Bradyrhizobium sp. STM 3843]CCE05823.1 putative Phage integrase [Bradyrhizobium sp. STM 3843]